MQVQHFTTRQPMVEFYSLPFPRFPLRKKKHKSYFGKNRTHDVRTSRCAGYLLDHSAYGCQTKNGTNGKFLFLGLGVQNGTVAETTRCGTVHGSKRHTTPHLPHAVSGGCAVPKKTRGCLVDIPVARERKKNAYRSTDWKTYIPT